MMTLEPEVERDDALDEVDDALSETSEIVTEVSAEAVIETDASARGPLWAVVPAAGHGSRMHDPRVPGSLPKQYRALDGTTLIERVLHTLLSMPDLQGVVVALSSDDVLFPSLDVATDARVHTTDGGVSRALSVAAGLAWLSSHIDGNARVLVHDAARPLISASDIRRLINAVENHGACGGLLAAPVQDTLKRVNSDHQVETTISRASLWQAQTPQLFGLEALGAALDQALADTTLAATITDEASAMEACGHAPLIVESLDPNPKMTRPADLDLALAWLKRPGAECA